MKACTCPKVGVDPWCPLHERFEWRNLYPSRFATYEKALEFLRTGDPFLAVDTLITESTPYGLKKNPSQS